MGVPFYILSWLQDLECSEPPYLSTFGCCPVPPRLIEGRDFEMQKWKRLKLSHPTKWTTGPPLSKRGGPNISIAIHRYPSLSITQNLSGASSNPLVQPRHLHLWQRRHPGRPTNSAPLLPARWSKIHPKPSHTLRQLRHCWGYPKPCDSTKFYVTTWWLDTELVWSQCSGL